MKKGLIILLAAVVFFCLS